MNEGSPATRRPSQVAHIIIVIMCLAAVSSSIVWYLLQNETQNFPENSSREAWRSFTFWFGWFLAIPTAGAIIALLGFYCLPRNQIRSFIALSLIASTLIYSFSNYEHWRSPPSAAAFFHLNFGTNLPESAQDIQVAGKGFGRDATHFLFKCTAADALALITQLQMTSVPHPDAEENDSYLRWPPPSRWPDPFEWSNARVFERLPTEKSGCGYHAIWNAQTNHIYVCTDPWMHGKS